MSAPYIRALIADDEDEMRFVLKRALEKMERIEVVGDAKNGFEAVSLAKRLKPDCVFLDVEMPGCDGVSAAKDILIVSEKTAVVFITAHQEYMPQAFGMYAFDYMIKPFNFERLKETVSRICARKTPEKIVFKQKEGIELVSPEDIVLIQRENRATAVITKRGKFFVSESLSELMDTLPAGYFIRSHKSYIINYHEIKKIYPYGRWTYVCEFFSRNEDALITSERLKELNQSYMAK